MESIELPVLYIPDRVMDLRKRGIESDEEEEKDVCFFRIDMIAPVDHKGRHCTEIFVGSGSFICTIPYEKLKTMIK